MKIVHINNIDDQGTQALCNRVTTSGLVSGYQRTNITISGAGIIESTAQSISIGLIPLPSFGLPFFDDICTAIWPKVIQPSGDDLMAEGYRALSDENIQLAEDLFSVDIDDWPSWEN